MSVSLLVICRWHEGRKPLYFIASLWAGQYCAHMYSKAVDKNPPWQTILPNYTRASADNKVERVVAMHPGRSGAWPLFVSCMLTHQVIVALGGQKK